MSRLSKDRKPEIDLKKPLVHIYKSAPDFFDRRLPVPVLCFLKERNPNNVADAGKKATCKICITMVMSKVNLLQSELTLARTQGTKYYLEELIKSLRDLLPDD